MTANDVVSESLMLRVRSLRARVKLSMNAQRSLAVGVGFST
jgi:hypothetical protein